MKTGVKWFIQYSLEQAAKPGLLTAVPARANPTLLFPWLYKESCSNEDLTLEFGGMSQGFDLNDEVHSCLSTHEQSSKSSH